MEMTRRIWTTKQVQKQGSNKIKIRKHKICPKESYTHVEDDWIYDWTTETVPY